MGKDIDTMTSQEIIEYLKQTHHHSVGQYASSIDLANIFLKKEFLQVVQNAQGQKLLFMGKHPLGIYVINVNYVVILLHLQKILFLIK